MSYAIDPRVKLIKEEQEKKRIEQKRLDKERQKKENDEYNRRMQANTVNLRAVTKTDTVVLENIDENE